MTLVAVTAAQSPGPVLDGSGGSDPGVRRPANCPDPPCWFPPITTPTPGPTPTPTPTPSPTPTPVANLRPPRLDPPIRGAFYYPWWNGEDRDNGEGVGSKWDACLGRNLTIDYNPQTGAGNQLLGCIPLDIPFGECERVHYRPDFDGDGRTEAYLWTPETIRTQIDNMRWGHISVAISSWWGNDSTEGRRLLDFLAWARNHDPDFKVAPYYEYGGTGNTEPQGEMHEYPDYPLPKVLAPGDPANLARELNFLFRDTWASSIYSSQMLYLDGRPVIFVYHPEDRNCETVALWRDTLDILENQYARPRPFVFLNYWRNSSSEGPRCPAADESDFGFHHYATGGPFKGVLVDGEFQTATIRPGFWRCRLTTPSQARDPDTWESAINQLDRSDVRWFELITSYNEWLEMTAIEPSIDWRINPPPGQDTEGDVPTDLGIYLQKLHLNPPRRVPSP